MDSKDGKQPGAALIAVIIVVLAPVIHPMVADIVFMAVTAACVCRL